MPLWGDCAPVGGADCAPILDVYPTDNTPPGDQLGWEAGCLGPEYVAMVTVECGGVGVAAIHGVCARVGRGNTWPPCLGCSRVYRGVVRYALGSGLGMRRPYAVLTLAQRRRRWANIKSALGTNWVTWSSYSGRCNNTQWVSDCEWTSLYVAICTIMAKSRQKEAESRDWALFLSYDFMGSL